MLSRISSGTGLEVRDRCRIQLNIPGSGDRGINVEVVFYNIHRSHRNKRAATEIDTKSPTQPEGLINLGLSRVIQG